MGSKHSEDVSVSLESVRDEVHSLRTYISRSLKSQLADVKADIFNQQLLEKKVFSETYRFPFTAMTSWAVTPELGCWLYDYVVSRRPKAVLEFGSGLSTLILAIALERIGGGKLTAIEHDEHYYKRTQELLRDAGLSELVNLVLAPLSPLELDGRTYNWYGIGETDLGKYFLRHEVDLLLVDGPPAASGPRARFPAFPISKPFLSDHSVIVLDDAERSDERAIADAWVNSSPGTLFPMAIPVTRRGPIVLSSMSADEYQGKHGELSLSQDSELESDRSELDADDIGTMLNSLVRKGALSIEAADSLIMRHKYFIEKLVSRHRFDFIEVISDASTARKGIASLSRDLVASNEARLELQQKVASSLTEIEALLLEKSRQDLASKQGELRESELLHRNSILETELASVTADRDRYREAVDQSQAEASRYRLDASRWHSEADRFRVDAERIAEKVAHLSGEVERHRTLAEEARSEAERAQAIAGEALAEAERSLRLADEARSETERSRAVADAAHSEAERVKVEIDQLSSTLRENDSRASELEGRLRALAAQYAARTKEQNATISALEKQLKVKKRALTERTSKLTSLDEELRRAEASIIHSRSQQETKDEQWSIVEASAELKLREVFALLNRAQGAASKSLAVAKMAKDQSANTKKHLSYRLGAVIVNRSESLSGWLSMPSALAKAHRSFKADRLANTTKPTFKDYLPRLLVGDTAVTCYADSKWQLFYFDAADRLTYVNLSATSVRFQGSLTVEWQLLPEGDEGDKVLAVELVDGEPQNIGSIPIGSSYCLRIRKTRGLPALFQIARHPATTAHAGLNGKRVSKPQAITKIASNIDTNPIAPLMALDTTTANPTGQEPATLRSHSVKPSDSHAIKVGIGIISKRSVLLDAYKTIESGNAEKGMQHAFSEANEKEKAGINILLANQSLDSDENWLDYVNSYLSSLQVAPLALRSGFEDRFFRLHAGSSKPEISRGPLISVIMPAYNCAKTLMFAANSILQQRWRRLELIIIDDCSDDETWVVMRQLAVLDPRVRLIRNPINCGPYVSKNRGLDIARGDYITGHDSDDWAHPERLSRHIEAILSDSREIKASVTKMVRLRSNGKFDRISAATENTHDGVLQTAFIATMFRADFLREQLGHWDCVRFGADSEIINRCKSLLGEGFVVYEQLGMLCLDSDESLTAHPLHGTRGRTSQTRKDYKKAFLAWHAQLKQAGQGYAMPFPHVPRNFAAPSVAAVPASDLKRIIDDTKLGRQFDLDVCIITDLRFPGGNASSTLDELNTCLSRGLKVKIFHCPSERSEGKAISSRYHEKFEHLEVQDFDVSRISAKVVIVRNPTVICSNAFSRLANVITTNHVVYVINNSRFRADGESAFLLETLCLGLSQIQATDSKVYPLGPRIRRELEGIFLPVPLARNDWHPLFDSSYYEFVPRQSMSKPLVIGRHGRDQIDKWPRAKEAVLDVYPESSHFTVRVLGGASIAGTTLGRIPKNWEVLPFGAVEVPEFLKSLDVFVYFPSDDLNEAFGRTVMEAIFAGVPCVLPHPFKESFGELAFYCGVSEVQGVLGRLAQNDVWRMEFVKHARDVAVQRFDSSALNARLHSLDPVFAADDEVRKMAPSIEGSLHAISQYKTWVETGKWLEAPVL